MCNYQPKRIKKRWSIENDAILDQLLSEKRNIIVTAGHFGNHELGNLALSFLIKYRVKAVYRPLNNKFFDDFFLNFRERYGSIMISMANASKEIAKTENFNYAFFL